MDVLRLWMRRHGPLSSVHQRAFVARREVEELCVVGSPKAVEHAIRTHQRLREILIAARSYDEEASRRELAGGPAESDRAASRLCQTQATPTRPLSAQERTTPKAEFACGRCDRQFVAAVAPPPSCRECGYGDLVSRTCRSCGTPCESADQPRCERCREVTEIARSEAGPGARGPAAFRLAQAIRGRARR